MTVPRQDQRSRGDAPGLAPPPELPRPPEETEPTIHPPDVACRRCGQRLALGAESCPWCGQKQYRQCFCGEVFPAGLARCPSCGTDWEKALRIRRRSRSEKVKPRALARSALLGAFLAVLGAGLLNLIISALAQRATPEGIVPANFGERLYYAWYTLASAVAKLLSALIGGLGSTLLVALAGAIIGALVYVLPTVWGRVSRSSRHHHHRARRRRSEH